MLPFVFSLANKCRTTKVHQGTVTLGSTVFLVRVTPDLSQS